MLKIIKSQRLQKHFLSAVAICFLAVLGVDEASGQGLTLVPFQGRVTDETGKALNGEYRIVFAIYSAPAGGEAMWSEPHDRVPIVDGQVNVLLGSVTPFDSGMFPKGAWERYLGITIGDDTNQELVPRHQLVPAFHAQTTSLAYAVANNAVTKNAIAAGSVTLGKIAAGAVDSAALAASSVDATKVQDGAVNEQKLAADSVTSSKLKDGSVTDAKLSPSVLARIAATETGGARFVGKVSFPNVCTWKSASGPPGGEPTYTDFPQSVLCLLNSVQVVGDIAQPTQQIPSITIPANKAPAGDYYVDVRAQGFMASQSDVWCRLVEKTGLASVTQIGMIWVASNYWGKTSQVMISLSGSVRYTQAASHSFAVQCHVNNDQPGFEIGDDRPDYAPYSIEFAVYRYPLPQAPPSAG